MKELLKERILANENLFESEELKLIEENEALIIKIYSLGFMDTTVSLIGGAE